MISRQVRGPRDEADYFGVRMCVAGQGRPSVSGCPSSNPASTWAMLILQHEHRNTRLAAPHHRGALLHGHAVRRFLRCKGEQGDLGGNLGVSAGRRSNRPSRKESSAGKGARGRRASPSTCNVRVSKDECAPAAGE